MRKSSRYTAIGWAVSKFVIPLAKRQAKRKVRKAARGVVNGPAGAAKRHPKGTGVAVGTALGAIGWAVARKHPRSGRQ